MAHLRHDILVTAEAFAQELAAEPELVVLDVRWRLDRPDGWDDYVAGHLPRAVYVRLDAELADPWQPPTKGRHPLPVLEDFENAARGWGINPDSRVVVYDDNAGLAAARAWWLLRYSGFNDVRLLDGGLSAWRTAGFALESGVFIPERGSVSLHYGALPVIGIEDVEGFTSYGTLLDARSGERFRGELEPVDPVAGHIPGAVSAPTTDNLDDEGAFLSEQELRTRFAGLGVQPSVAVYCGSGVTAAHEALALALAGYQPVLYPGSWSEWSNHPDRPVALGD